MERNKRTNVEGTNKQVTLTVNKPSKVILSVERVGVDSTLVAAGPVVPHVDNDGMTTKRLNIAKVVPGGKAVVEHKRTKETAVVGSVESEGSIGEVAPVDVNKVILVNKEPSSTKKGKGKIVEDKVPTSKVAQINIAPTSPTSTEEVVINKEPGIVKVAHADKGPSARRVILTTIEIAALAVVGYLGYQAWENQNDVNAAVLNKLATLNAPGLVAPVVLPTSTPTLAPTENPTATSIPNASPTPEATSTPEATARPDRLTEWTKFWVDTAQKAATMFGGTAADWTMSEKWNGKKTWQDQTGANGVNNESNLDQFGVKGYMPTEWKTTTQGTDPSAPNYWPTNEADAANYFFPDQKIEPKFLTQNEYGGWHLSEDHWLFDGEGNKTLSLHRGDVAEGYNVGPDGLMKTADDRAWVAFGGTEGILLNAKGQGMTIWMPGTDPNKIALAWTPYSSSYYRGPGGEQLGPDAINFTPIYNTPGFDIISAVPQNHDQVHLGGGQLAKMTRPPAERHAAAYQKNPFKGNKNIYRA